MINRTESSYLIPNWRARQGVKGIDPDQVTITIPRSNNERLIVLAQRLKAKGGIGMVVAALIDGK